MRWRLCGSVVGVALVCTVFQPPARTAGGEFFVASNGAPWGTGTMANPWDLQTALNHPPAVQAGATIWLRGGVYYGSFTSRLRGSSGAPIVVRNYQGERVTLDNASDCDTLNAVSSY